MGPKSVGVPGKLVWLKGSEAGPPSHVYSAQLPVEASGPPSTGSVSPTGPFLTPHTLFSWESA